MNELATMSVRIAGLFLIVFTVSKIPVHNMAYTIRPEYGILSYTLPSAITIIVGIFLLMFPKTISKRLMDSAPEQIELSNPMAILNILCIAIGVVFLFYSISDLVFHISTGAFLHFSHDYELTLLTFDYPGAIATIIELLFSLLLVFRTKLFLDIIYKYSK